MSKQQLIRLWSCNAAGAAFLGGVCTVGEFLPVWVRVAGYVVCVPLMIFALAMTQEVAKR